VTLAELDELQVGFVSINEGIDLGTPAGRLQMHILAAIAEFERERDEHDREHKCTDDHNPARANILPGVLLGGLRRGRRRVRHDQQGGIGGILAG
jgi:hypothetical protein